MAGETTSLTAAQAVVLRGLSNAELKAILFPSISYATTELEVGDIKQIGYLPAWFKPVAWVWLPTDMDTNVSPLVSHTVKAGSTAVTIALTGAQSATAQIVPSLAFTPTGSPALVTTTAVAAATAASGTATLIALGVYVP